MFRSSSRGRAYVRNAGYRSMENSSKAKESSYLEMRFLIPKQNAELIIGPNGSNIKRLHMEYCAMINISDNAGSERILTVGGFDIPTMVNMLQDIITGLKGALLEIGFGDTDVVGMLLDETEVDYITSIDDRELNQILEDSGTHIDVFLMCCPLSSDRIIRIRGEPECICQCILSLHQLLQWCPTPANPRQYNADNADEEYAADYGGYTAADDVTERSMEISFEDNIHPDSDQTAVYSATNNPPDYFVSENSTVTTLKFSIQSTLVGAILGKGGSRLNHIRQESMAHIKLDSEIQSPERVITITGTQEEVENATKLLRICIQHFCVQII